MSMRLKKGDVAPHLELVNDKKEKVEFTFPAEKTKLLLFFPLAFSSTCTMELCQVRDEFEEYKELDAEVYGISVDSPYVLKKFREEQNYEFNLLSDFNKEASRAYEALHDVFSMNLKGVSKRAAFVIDRQGVIQYAEVLEDPGQVPNFAKIKDVLKKIN